MVSLKTVPATGAGSPPSPETTLLSAAAAWAGALEVFLGVRVRALQTDTCMAGDGPFCRALGQLMPDRPQCLRVHRALQLGEGAERDNPARCPFGFSLLGRPLRVAGACAARIEVGPFRCGAIEERQVRAALQICAPARGQDTALLRIHHSTPALSPERRDGAIVLLARIAQSLAAEPARPSPGFGLSEPPAVRAARLFIEQHLEEPLGVTRLAAHTGLSPDHFARVFKRAAGSSVSTYVNRLRVEKACSHLAGTGQQVAEISYACGFESVPHFNRTFRRLTGMAPTAYRLTSRQATPVGPHSRDPGL